MIEGGGMTKEGRKDGRRGGEGEMREREILLATAKFAIFF